MNMRHYFVYTIEPRASEVFKFIYEHDLEFELHLTRTRFWVPKNSKVLTELLLRFSECVYLVDEALDLASGLPIGPNLEL